MPAASEPASVFQPGDRVVLRAREWTVLQRSRFDRCETLRLERHAAGGSQTFILPFDRPRRLDRARTTVLSRRAWLHAWRHLLDEAFPYGGLRRSPKTVALIPYQLEPALAVLRYGHPRLLIADAVGMGKTIEAGHILRELAQTRGSFRALILVPAGLRPQWDNELQARFDLRPVVADAGWLHRTTCRLPPDVNPWSPPGVYLASFDFVKRAEALRPLEEVRWDVLVVDEAHAASLTSDRRAAIDALASRSHRVLLLTGTPPTEASELNGLCRIGELDGEGPIVLFRRQRPSTVGRRSVLLSVRASPDERRLHELLERYTSLVWNDAGRSDPHARLASVTLRKRALSSTVALQRSLRRRQELLAGAPPMSNLQLLLPLEDEELQDAAAPDEVLGRAGLTDRAEERAWIAKLLASTSVCRESKAQALLRLLARVREPAIVFTEYRHTLEYLQRVLENAGMPLTILHGGMNPGERRQALADFGRDGRTLLATDAAAEGLNLQRTCRLVVHYELPWNPLRMVQRTGRVDRIGQSRRVHEIALVASHTAEALVLAPLARRATAWSGDDASQRMLTLLSESRVADAVFEGRIPDFRAGPFLPPQARSLELKAEAEAEVMRLAATLRLSAGARAKADGCYADRGRGDRRKDRAGVAVTTLTRSALAPGLVLVFELASATPSGDIVEQSSAAIHVRLVAVTWPNRPAQMRQRLSTLLPVVLNAVAPVLEGLRRRQLERTQPIFAASAARFAARAASIEAVQHSAARRLVQAGLFEWRPARTSARDVTSPLLQTAQPGTNGDLIGSAALRAVLVVPER